MIIAFMCGKFFNANVGKLVRLVRPCFFFTFPNLFFSLVVFLGIEDSETLANWTCSSIGVVEISSRNLRISFSFQEISRRDKKSAAVLVVIARNMRNGEVELDNIVTSIPDDGMIIV